MIDKQTILRVRCIKCDEYSAPMPDDGETSRHLIEAGWDVHGAAAVCTHCLEVMASAVALPDART